MQYISRYVRRLRFVSATNCRIHPLSTKHYFHCQNIFIRSILSDSIRDNCDIPVILRKREKANNERRRDCLLGIRVIGGAEFSKGVKGQLDSMKLDKLLLSFILRDFAECELTEEGAEKDEANKTKGHAFSNSVGIVRNEQFAFSLPLNNFLE